MNTAKKATGLAAGRKSGSTQKPSAGHQAVFVRLNAQITESEHQKLKIHAAKHKTTISDLLRGFIGTLPD